MSVDTASDSGRRPLGFASLFALGVNGIVGVGIFFAPAAVAAEFPGVGGAAFYVVTALALLPIALGYAVLGSRFSVDGGPYVWAEAAFGPRFAFFVGWITFASALTSLAAVLSGLAHQLSAALGLMNPTVVHGVAVVAVLCLASLAASGLRLSAVVWTGITVLKLVPLAALLGFGVVMASRAPPVPAAVHSGDLHGAFRAVLVVVFALQGFEIVPLLAGSVRRSERTVPWSTVGALLFAAMLYAALQAIAARAVPELGKSHAPLIDAARVYGGASTAAFVALGANVSAIGIGFGMFNTTPRYLSALSGPGAFGPWIARLDARRVPQRALWLTAFAVVLLVALSDRPSELFVLSSLTVLAQYSTALAALGVLALRRTHGVPRRALWIVALSVVGIALAAHGAELREVIGILGVYVLGEAIRRITRAV